MLTTDYTVLHVHRYGSGRRFRLTKLQHPSGLIEWIGQDTQTIDPLTNEPLIVARDARIKAAIDACFATLTPVELAQPYIMADLS